MAQSFNVNGKEYLQSNVLAVTFGYTSDYIGKLAREEKILGTQVGRQWFIEPESLKVFLQKAQVEKELRKSVLSRQRKFEHASFQGKPSRSQFKIPTATLASVQAVAILVCGLFAGGLGWVTISENIQVGDLETGASDLRNLIVHAVSPVDAVLQLQENAKMFLAASGNSSDETFFERSPMEQAGVYATLPLFNSSEELSLEHVATSSSLLSEATTASTHFSDEVDVVVDDQGKQLIKPVFRSESSSSMLFMLVPVTEKEN